MKKGKTMAKEQLHNWGRYIFLAIVIVFACGGYAMKIIGNTTAIEKNIIDIEEVEENVIDLKLQYKDIENLTSGTLNVLTEINSKLDVVQRTQSTQAIIQAVNSEKLKTLTKD